MGKKRTETDRNRHKGNDTAQIIMNAVITYLKESKGLKCPTRLEIAELTGLSVKTVERYYSGLEFTPSVAPQRALTPIVLNNLFAQTSRSPQAVKLWLQVMEGWSENVKLQSDVEGITIKHEFLDGKPDDVDLSL